MFYKKTIFLFIYKKKIDSKKKKIVGKTQHNGIDNFLSTKAQLKIASESGRQAQRSKS